jgi:hypothetical protein
MKTKMNIRFAGFLLLILLSLQGKLFSQNITLSVADSVVDAGAELLLPVLVNEITEEDGVFSAELRFTSSSSVASIIGVETEGTILEGLNTLFNATSGDFAFAEPAAVEGEGVFVFLRVLVRDDATKFQQAEIRINSAQFNEGDPPVVTGNGLVRIRGIDLTPKSPPVIVEGQSFQFNLSGDIVPPVTWSTTNEDIATISSNGLLQAISPGTIKVHVSDSDGQSDSTNFFRIEPETLLDLAVGVTSKSVTQSLEDTVQVFVSDITGLNITSGQFDLNFTSSRLEILGFSYEGTLLEGRPAPVIFQDGSTVRFAFADAEPYSGEGALVNIHFRVLRNATGSAQFTPQNVLFNETFEAATSPGTITIANAPQINLSFPEDALTIGETMIFSVTDGGTAPYTWSLDNSSVASIDELTGEFTALSRGDVSVIATDAQGFESDPAEIRVNDVTLFIEDRVVSDFETFVLPINVTDVSGLGITAFEMDVSFDDTILEFSGINTGGTITEGVSLFSSEEDGLIKIAAAGTQPLQGEGVFLELLFSISESSDYGSAAELVIEKGQFNEPGPSTPTATLRGGAVLFLEDSLPGTVFLTQPEQGQFNVSVRPEFIWESAELAETYTLQVSEDELFTSTVLDTTGLSSLTFQPETDLDFLSEYYWRVRAQNNEGSGPWSDVRSFTTEPDFADAPLLAEPANDAEGVARNAELRWFPSLFAEEYFAEAALDEEFESIVFSSETADTSVTAQGLAFETTYHWRVTARNIRGDGGVSETFRFTTETDPGDPVQVVDAVASSVSASSPHIADGTDVSEVIITLVDTEGEPVSGLDPGDFDIGLTGSAVQGALSETAEPGTYSFEVTNETAETVTVTVIADGVELDDKPEIVFEEADDPDQVVDAAASSVTASTPHIADGTDASEVIITLIDTEGEPVSGLDPGDFDIGLTGSAVQGALSETAEPGTYSFEVTNETAETVKVTVIADGVELDDKPEIVFEEADAPIFAGGDGSADNPFQVANLTQLNSVRDFLDASFIQIADIDASETLEWNEGAGFEPIGSWTTPSTNSPFTGTYDGNGFTISGLFINDNTSDYVGLFVFISDGEVRDLTLHDVSISGMDNPSYTSGRQEGLGAVTGRNDGTISNVVVTGQLDGLGNQIGGIVGDNLTSGVIENSSVNAEVANPSVFFTGGVAGINRGEILNTHSSGVINGRTAVGGISGSNSGVIFQSSSTMDVIASENDAGGISGRNTNTIEESFATGDITGVQNVGGLAGSSSGFFDIREGFIINSYATGNVTGESRVGGLLGIQPGGGNTINSYAAGQVNSTVSFVGGLVGLNNINSTFTNSFWNIETTGQTSTSTSGTLENVSGLTAYEMMEASFYDSWDLDLIWEIEQGENASYPYLRTNEPERIPGLSVRGDFGTVAANTTSIIAIEITNPLDSTVLLSGFTVIGGSAENVAPENNFETELGPGETAEIEIAWSPQTESDILRSVLQIEHNSDELADDQFWVRLSGEAVEGDDPLIDAQNSEVTATSPHIADGIDASLVTVVLVDTLGAPVTGLDTSDFVIQLTGSAVSGTISDGEAAGTYTFEVVNEVAEVVIVTVTADGVELDDKPEIVFESVEVVVDASASSVSATSPHIADGEDVSLVTVTAVDENGDVISGLNSSDFTIILTGSAEAGTITETGEPGTYTFEVSNTIAETVIVSVTIFDTELDDAPQIVFEEPPVIIDPVASSVAATSPHAADGVDASTVTLHIIDVNSEPVSGLEAGDFSVNLTGSAVSGAVEETEQPGTYRFEVTNQTPETVTITVTVLDVELEDRPLILFETDEPIPVPDSPEIVSIQATDEGLELIWDADSEEFTAEYVIYRGSALARLEPYETLPAGTFTFSDQDLIDGTAYYSVAAANSNGEESALSIARTFINSSVSASFDWTLSSVAVNGASVETDMATLFSFSNQYLVNTEMSPGQGYWLKTRTFDEETYPVRGPGLESSEFELNEGWNLIGSLADTVAVDSIIDDDGILTGTPVYQFNGGQYSAANQILPNKGYWIFAQQQGSVSMEINTDPSAVPGVLENDRAITDLMSQNNLSGIESKSVLRFGSGTNSATLYISGFFVDEETQMQYILPPMAPDPILDVRTDQNSRLIHDGNARLLISASEYPITVELDQDFNDPDSAYSLRLEREGESLSLSLFPGQQQVISGEYDVIELTRMSSNEMVAETRLYPNYPNPFNPSTTIHYQLSEQANVTIEVFDVSGRRVGVLTNEIMRPGEYRVSFDAGNLASGIYFIRFVAGNHTELRKITLIK